MTTKEKAINAQDNHQIKEESTIKSYEIFKVLDDKNSEQICSKIFTINKKAYLQQFKQKQFKQKRLNFITKIKLTSNENITHVVISFGGLSPKIWFEVKDNEISSILENDPLLLPSDCDISLEMYNNESLLDGELLITSKIYDTIYTNLYKNGDFRISKLVYNPINSNYNVFILFSELQIGRWNPYCGGILFCE